MPKKKGKNKERVADISNLFKLDGIMEELLVRSEELEYLEKMLEKRIMRLPDGRLRVSNVKNRPQYYHVKKTGDSKGTYIRKDKMDLASALAEKDYAVKVLERTRIIRKKLDSFIAVCKPGDITGVYDDMIEARKKLVEPVVYSDREYVLKWLEEPYEANEYCKDEKKYETLKGDYVRSKSEAIIANLYFEKGIPYKYECPVTLKNGGIKYPDFTILKMPERKIIYHEHFGMFDDENYRFFNMKKISDYIDSGIVSGKNLIMTFEMSSIPFNSGDISKLIDDCFGI